MANTINRIEWVLTTEDRASRPMAAATAKQKAALDAQKKAFKDNAKTADQSSKSISSSYKRSATDIEKSTTTIKKSNDTHARSLDRLNASLGNTTHETKIFKAALNALKFPSLIAGAGIAAQAVGTLGAASVAAVSALAPLSGAIAAYPALGSAAAQAFGVVKLAMLGVTDAVGGLNDKMDPEKLAKLSEEGQKFAKSLDSLKKPVLDLQKSAQKGLFPGLTEATKTLRPLMGQFRDEFEQTGKVIGNLAADGAKMLASGPWSKDLQAQAQVNAKWIGQLGHAGLNFADALRNVVRAAEPLVSWMVRVVGHASELTKAWAQNARDTGKLGQFFAQTRQVMSLVGGTLLHVASGLIQVGKAAQPLGFHILRGLNAEAKKFSDWTKTVSGQNKLKAYFHDATPAVDEFGRLLEDIGGAFLRLSRGNQTLPLLKALRTELLPVLEDVVTNTTKAFGPALISALTQFVRLIGDFAGSNGPLTIFVTMLGDAAHFLHNLINFVPGLKPLLVTMAGAAAVMKVFSVAGKFSGLTALIGLMGKLRAASLGAAAAETAAATAGGAAGAGGILGTGKGAGKIAAVKASAATGLAMFGGPVAIGIIGGLIGRSIAQTIKKEIPKGTGRDIFSGFTQGIMDIPESIVKTTIGIFKGKAPIKAAIDKASLPKLQRDIDDFFKRQKEQQLRVQTPRPGDSARVRQLRDRYGELLVAVANTTKGTEAHRRAVARLRDVQDKLNEKLSGSLSIYDDAGGHLRRLKDKAETARGKLRQLEKAGQGNSDEAKTLRDRLKKLNDEIGNIEEVAKGAPGGISAVTRALRDLKGAATEAIPLIGGPLTDALEKLGAASSGAAGAPAATPRRASGAGHRRGGWMFASGGVVPALMSGGEMYLDPQTAGTMPPGVLQTIAARQAPHFAGGGMVVPGDPRRDATPVLAQPGGFVLTGDGQQMLAGMMGYAKGGWVRMGATQDWGSDPKQTANKGFSFAELNVAGANKGRWKSADMAAALGVKNNPPSAGVDVGLKMGSHVTIKVPGKQGVYDILKSDNGSGQSSPHFKIDLHEGIAKKLGMGANTSADVLVSARGRGGGAPGTTDTTPGTKDKTIPGHTTSALSELDATQAARILPDWLAGSQRDAYSQGIALGMSGRSLINPDGTISEALQTLITGARVPTEKTPDKNIPGTGETTGRKPGYPLARAGKLIGTPHQGTHTRGDWQSDNAVDLGTPPGTAVLASMSGTISRISGQLGKAGPVSGLSATIADKIFYTHMKQRVVREGDKVKRGDVIGRSGTANGVAHLHFGVKPPGSPFDYMTRKGGPKMVKKTPASGGGGGGGGGTGPKGLAHYGGKRVAGWIKPYLLYGAGHGWHGGVTSGYRTYAEQKRIYDSGVRPAAKPGTSNHEGINFPRGAVDVTNASQLNSAIQRYKYHQLKWAGSKDPVHFSHPHGGSYRRGGFVGGMQRFRGGGAVPKPPKTGPLADILTLIGGIAGTSTTKHQADISDAMIALADMVAQLPIEQVRQIIGFVQDQIRKLAVGGVTKTEHKEILRLSNIISELNLAVGDQVGKLAQYVADALADIQRQGTAFEASQAISGVDPGSAAGLAARAQFDLLKGGEFANLMPILQKVLDDAIASGEPEAIKTAQENVNALTDAISDNFVDYVTTVKQAAIAQLQEGIDTAQNVIDKSQATFELESAVARAMGGPTFAGSAADLRGQSARQRAAAPQFAELAGKYGSSSFVKALQGDLQGARADEIAMIQAQTASANATADAADLLLQAARAEMQAAVDWETAQNALRSAMGGYGAAQARLAGGPDYVGSPADLRAQAAALTANVAGLRNIADAYERQAWAEHLIGDETARANADTQKYQALTEAINAIADAADLLLQAAKIELAKPVEAAQAALDLQQAQFGLAFAQERYWGGVGFANDPAATMRQTATSAGEIAKRQQGLASSYYNQSLYLRSLGDTKAADEAWNNYLDATAASLNSLSDAADALRGAAEAQAQTLVDAAHQRYDLDNARLQGLELQQRLAGTFETGGAARGSFITRKLIPDLQKELVAMQKQFKVAQHEGDKKLADQIALSIANQQNAILQAQLDAQEAIKSNTEPLNNLTGPIGFEYKGQLETARFATALAGG